MAYHFKGSKKLPDLLLVLGAGCDPLKLKQCSFYQSVFCSVYQIFIIANIETLTMRGILFDLLIYHEFSFEEIQVIFPATYADLIPCLTSVRTSCRYMLMKIS